MIFFTLQLKPQLSFLSVISLVTCICICVADFPKGFLEDIVESPVVKARLNSRWKWEVWDVVPGTHTFNIYVFNLTNPKEFENGEKPNLEQVGPYSYVEHRVKFHESVNLDLSVNYERNFTYTFDPSKSKGKEEDLINIVNIPLIIFSSVTAKVSSNEVPTTEVIAAINELVKKGEGLTKSNVAVGDLIFNGLDVSKYRPYLHLLRDQSSWLAQEFGSGRYGVLKIRRGAYEGPYTVDSGLKDETQFGYIRSWNNAKLLPWWARGSKCNEISDTTDGTVYHGNVDKSTILNIFDIDMCRAIQFKYVKDEIFRDIVEEYQFKLADDLLEDPRVASKNLCFCKQKVGNNPDNCLKKGALDISACQEGAPYIISFAHFLDANQEYLNSVEGLQPNPKLHETSLDIQPRLGVIVSYNKRFQWNLYIKPIPGVLVFKNVKPIVLPILWNDDNFQLDDDKANLLVAEIANQEGGVGAAELNLSNPRFIVSFTLLTCMLAKVLPH